MAKQLWFLRHGEAEPHGTRADAQRRLTERGEHQSRVAGQALAQLRMPFDRVLTSPRVRARDTARLACESLGCEPVLHEPLSGGFDARQALELVAGVPDGGSLLLVGHEPDFSAAVRAISGARVDLKKGGLAGLRLRTSGGELLMLVRPVELELMAMVGAT